MLAQLPNVAVAAATVFAFERQFLEVCLHVRVETRAQHESHAAHIAHELAHVLLEQLVRAQARQLREAFAALLAHVRLFLSVNE